MYYNFRVNTLGSSGLLSNAEYTTGQIFDLSEKLEQSESSLSRGYFLGADGNDKRNEDKLTKATRDCCRASIELIHGLMTQIAKDKLFNSVGQKK